MISAFICIGFIALCGKTQGSLLLACKIGAFIFAIITAVVMGLLVLEQINRRVSVMTEWMDSFGRLDNEGRAAVAFAFPTMRYRMKNGTVREMFEDTDVAIETFRLFLKTSNDKYISPEREWVTAEMSRNDWQEIKSWLEAQGYIIKDSASGSHSWLWHGNAYKHLMAYWMAGRNVSNMNYAYETE